MYHSAGRHQKKLGSTGELGRAAGGKGRLRLRLLGEEKRLEGVKIKERGTRLTRKAG